MTGVIFMWLFGRRERRRKEEQKEIERHQEAVENLKTLTTLSEMFSVQVERLEQVTDRLEGALSE